MLSKYGKNSWKYLRNNLLDYSLYFVKVKKKLTFVSIFVVQFFYHVGKVFYNTQCSLLQCYYFLHEGSVDIHSHFLLFTLHCCPNNNYITHIRSSFHFYFVFSYTTLLTHSYKCYSHPKACWFIRSESKLAGLYRVKSSMFLSMVCTQKTLFFCLSPMADTKTCGDGKYHALLVAIDAEVQRDDLNMALIKGRGRHFHSCATAAKENIGELGACFFSCRCALRVMLTLWYLKCLRPSS